MTTFVAKDANPKQMEIELSELMEHLQGHWKLDTGEQTILIISNELTVFTKAEPEKTTFQLIRNLQLKKWQIKVLKPISWLRTFIIDITPDTFMLYDFNLTVNVEMAQRSKLLNPSRVFKYTRVAMV